VGTGAGTDDDDDAQRRSDAELVAALRADEPWARRAIWDRHVRRVRRYLSRTLGPPRAEVEDLTQEVFLRVFSRRHAIDRPSALREFVMSVTVRVLKWELRRRWVRRNVALAEGSELPELVVERTGEEDARDVLRRCYRIMDQLPARERVAFALRYMEEMTMEEVAATMRISVSTAKRLTSRAARTIATAVSADKDLAAHFKGNGLETLQGAVREVSANGVDEDDDVA
jgi:RNA polymerase sigma-70 factor (ECF subfamily)